jgi:aryl-alcohol dehydrogenase-like predicted oxidoreductase
MTNIPRRDFGATGLSVSALGLGGGQMGGGQLDDRAVDRLLGLALDLGVNLVDTARGYGRSEARLGRFLAGRRPALIVSTKVGYGVPGQPDWTYGAVATGVDDALRILSTDYIDIVHLHSCSLEILQRGEVITALEDARQAGKLRVAAYSGENEALDFAVATGRFQAVQTSLNLADQRGLDRVVPAAQAAGLGVIAKRPVANAPWRFAERPYGHYAEEYWYRWQAMDFDPRGLDWHALALRFIAYQPGVHTCIVGTTNPEHLRQNAEIVARGPLPEDFVAEVRAAFRAHDDDWMGLT